VSGFRHPVHRAAWAAGGRRMSMAANSASTAAAASWRALSCHRSPLLCLMIASARLLTRGSRRPPPTERRPAEDDHRAVLLILHHVAEVFEDEIGRSLGGMPVPPAVMRAMRASQATSSSKMPTPHAPFHFALPSPQRFIRVHTWRVCIEPVTSETGRPVFRAGAGDEAHRQPVSLPACRCRSRTAFHPAHRMFSAPWSRRGRDARVLAPPLLLINNIDRLPRSSRRRWGLRTLSFIVRVLDEHPFPCNFFNRRLLE